MLAGARLLAAADDTVDVWAARVPLAAGQQITASAVEVRRVGFTDATAEAYVSAGRAFTPGTVVTRSVDAGELIPRAALATQTPPMIEVPVPVSAGQLPSTIERGSVVDVWVVPEQAAAARGEEVQQEAERVLDDVTVVAVPRSETVFGPEGTVALVVGVPADRADLLERALAGTATGRVVVTRQG